MLKSCQYCGRVHKADYDCGCKPKMKARNSKVDRFRYTSAWQKKREHIRELDNYLCQVCLRNLYGSRQIINGMDISVHHIDKLEEAFEKRLDDDNLITLCEIHHKQADRGEIPKQVLQNITKQRDIPPEG